MTTLTFFILSSLIILALIAMIGMPSKRLVLMGWILVSLILASFFYLLGSPLTAVLQILLTVSLGSTFAFAIKESPKVKTHPLSASTLVIMILASLGCLSLTLIISLRLWSLPHIGFPENLQNTPDTLAFAQLFTGQNIVLVFGAVLLLLTGLVSLVVLSRRGDA